MNTFHIQDGIKTILKHFSFIIILTQEKSCVLLRFLVSLRKQFKNGFRCKHKVKFYWNLKEKNQSYKATAATQEKRMEEKTQKDHVL